MESSLCGFGFCCFVRGARLFWSPANPAFGFLFCPPSPKGKDIPPTRARRALFPGGKGENHSFLMQGASPLASPGLSGARHWLDLPARHSAGGLLSCLPANIAFSLLSCPPSPKGKDIPPTRARRALFPGGKGENHCFLMQGASPPAPRGAGRGAALTVFAVNHEFSPPADRVNLGTAIPYGIGRQLQSI